MPPATRTPRRTTTSVAYPLPYVAGVAGRGTLKGGRDPVRWNLRLAAANRGVWKAGEMQHLLADHGLVVSAGKMSGMWSGRPASVKLDDLDAICAALGCGVADLLIPEPEKAARPGGGAGHPAAAEAAARSAAPRRRDGRSLPPE